MELTTGQLWERIQQSGLASPEVCRSWASEIVKVAGPNVGDDAKSLSTELVRTSRLTSFQLDAILEAVPWRLVVGSYQILDTLSHVVGPRWYLAQESIQKTPKWCYRWGSHELIESFYKDWPPSLEWGRRHSRIEHSYLNRWEAVLAEPGILAAITDPVPGKPLSQLLSKQPLSLQQSIQMVSQVARGLRVMHESGLMHGWITPESVWFEETGVYRLMRDPLFPPRSPYQGHRGILPISDLHRLASAAPEYTLPTTEPSVQTDLYALGVLWAHALGARSPWPNADRLDAAGWKSTHQRLPLELPAGVPPMIANVIQHLTGKNPSSRFQDVRGLLEAIVPDIVVGPKGIETGDRDALPGQIDVSSAAEVTEPSASPKRQESPPKSATTQPKFTTAPPEIIVPIVTKASPPSIDKAGEEKSSKPSSVPNPSGAMDLKRAWRLDRDVTSDKEVADPATAPTPQRQPGPSPATVQNTSAKTTVSLSTSTISKSRAPKRKRKKPKWFMPLIAVGSTIVMGGLLALLLSGNRGPATSNKPETKIEVVESGGAATNQIAPATTADPMGEFFNVANDNGQLPWVPPFFGQPQSVELFPAGAEMMVFLSEDVWRGNGPFANVKKWWLDELPDCKQVFSDMPWSEDPRVSKIALALYPRRSGGEKPDLVVRLTLQDAIPIEELLKATTGFRSKVLEPAKNEQIWNKNEFSFGFERLASAPNQPVKQIVFGPTHLIESLSDTGGGSSPLRRQMESLLQHSDGRSDIYILGAPSYLFGDGKDYLSAAPRSVDILQQLLDDRVQAFSTTIALGSQLYLEARTVLADAAASGKIATDWKRMLDKVPNEVEASFVSTPPPPYWRALAVRYPQMLRRLASLTRMGIEDGQVVANMYLPAESFGNLAVSTWMGLQKLQADGPSRESVATAPPARKSIEQLLDSTMKISFDQESLEMGLAAIASEFNESILAGQPPLKFRIQGGAFQKEGITQNQQIRAFKHEGSPLRVVLTDLVRRANPVTTVKSPVEKDQKVVWVVVEDPESPGSKKIELTTRTWAEANSVGLPKEFIANP